MVLPTEMHRWPRDASTRKCCGYTPVAISSAMPTVLIASANKRQKRGLQATAGSSVGRISLDMIQILSITIA